MRTLGVALLLANLASCTPPRDDAATQPSPPVVAPNYDPTVDPLQTGAGGEFRGSSLIFSADPDPADLAGLLTESTMTRKAKAAWRGFERGTVRPEAERATQLAEAEKATIADAGRDPVVAAARVAAARAFWPTRLQELVDAGFVDAAAATRATGIFDAYCEAKVWELAAAALTASSALTARPTPFMACEDYYQRVGLLQEPVCAAAPSGRDYVDCVFEDGLFKTRFFAGKYRGVFTATPSEVKETKLRALVDDGTVKRVLLGEDLRSLKTAIVNQKKLVTSRVFGVGYKDAFVPDGGTPSEVPTLPLWSASPAMVIRAVEDGAQTTTPAELVLFPGAHTNAAKTAIQTLVADLSALAQRVSTQPSVSDYLFTSSNVPLEVPANLATASERPSLAPIFATMTDTARSRLAAIRGDIDASQARLATYTEQGDVLYGVFMKHMSTSAVMASLNGVGDALWINSVLQLKPTDAGALVEFRLDDLTGGGLRVCWDLASEAQTTCPVIEGELSVTSTTTTTTTDWYLLEDSATVHHDKTTTRLKLEVVLDDPRPIGFNLRVATPGTSNGDPYSYLDPDELAGATLRVELYPNVVDGLPFYSGSLKIVETTGGVESVVHEGVVNLLGN